MRLSCGSWQAAVCSALIDSSDCFPGHLDEKNIRRRCAKQQNEVRLVWPVHLAMKRRGEPTMLRTAQALLALTGVLSLSRLSLAAEVDQIRDCLSRSSDPGEQVRCMREAEAPEGQRGDFTAIQSNPPSFAGSPASEADVWARSIDPLPNGGWQYITSGSGDSANVVFASSHNMVRNGNIVTVWLRWEYMKAQSSRFPPYKSEVVREQIDCGRLATRLLSTSYYANNNLEGQPQTFVADEHKQSWEPAIPGTVGEYMVQWVCSKPKRAAPNAHPH
jgi:hypothetical protein